ncbi:hypothetical protein BCR34DRAFT_210735 [Clohesyomyces aquaticus]|uniref:Uncharacterized protein n=1 Tax=Clohesyomyces aquaticus TaxID=1231657 RepID=A0A1Y2AA49_9PLEO|nr:hypothetical protein BCR34DRAFT_210735 [Clohesyomyces aquaticus]
MPGQTSKPPRQAIARRILPCEHKVTLIIGPRSGAPGHSPPSTHLQRQHGMSSHEETFNAVGSTMDRNIILRIRIPYPEEERFMLAWTRHSSTPGVFCRDEINQSLIYTGSLENLRGLVYLGIGLPPCDLDPGLDWAYIHDDEGIAWFTQLWQSGQVGNDRSIYLIHGFCGGARRVGPSGLTPEEFRMRTGGGVDRPARNRRTA